MSALITLSGSLKALTVIRSLGKKNIRVISADVSERTLGNYSKYTTKSMLIPYDYKNQSKYIGCLLSYLKRNQIDVLMPVHSNDTYLIIKHKKKFEKFTKVPFSEYNKVSALNDKWVLDKILTSLEIKKPDTYRARNIKDLKEVSRKIEYPAVIKLKSSSSSLGLSFVYSREQLIKRYLQTINKYCLRKKDYPIIQEYVEGTGYGVSLLYNQGDIRALFTHKRIREYPIDGGPSTARVSTRNKEMEDMAIKLLDHVEWHGVAMVEFKQIKNNKPILLEVNPRFWGSINQAVQSGVDFPYLLYKMAVEGDVKPVRSYKVGVKTRNTLIDFISLKQSIIRNRDVSLLKEFFASYHEDVFSWKDPKPFISFIEIGLREIRSPKS
jgi:predicted ATP-grasp superfamily ATP-dependent carboligase